MKEFVEEAHKASHTLDTALRKTATGIKKLHKEVDVAVQAQQEKLNAAQSKSYRQLQAERVMGQLEEATNHAVHKAHKTNKRRVKNKQARQSRRKNR